MRTPLWSRLRLHLRAARRPATANPTAAEAFFAEIDWRLLRIQKLWLLELETTGPHRDGVVHLIDGLQDCAVDRLGYSARRIFGHRPRGDRGFVRELSLARAPKPPSARVQLALTERVCIERVGHGFRLDCNFADWETDAIQYDVEAIRIAKAMLEGDETYEYNAHEPGCYERFTITDREAFEAQLAAFEAHPV